MEFEGEDIESFGGSAEEEKIEKTLTFFERIFPRR